MSGCNESVVVMVMMLVTDRWCLSVTYLLLEMGQKGANVPHHNRATNHSNVVYLRGVFIGKIHQWPLVPQAECSRRPERQRSACGGGANEQLIGRRLPWASARDCRTRPEQKSGCRWWWCCYCSVQYAMVVGSSTVLLSALCLCPLLARISPQCFGHHIASRYIPHSNLTCRPQWVQHS